MSTVYNADGTLPEATNPAQVSIVSSTNTTPIVVTTGTHGYADGDTIEIEAHLVNTHANGLWTIAVLSPTTFSLNGSVGNGVGGATGYVVDYAVNPLLTLPSDLVDALDAASVNVPIEGIFNAVPWLYQRTGRLRLLQKKYAYLGSIFSTTAGNAAMTTSFGSMGLSLTLDFAVRTTDVVVAKLTGAVFGTGTIETAVGIGFDTGGGVTLYTGSTIDLEPSTTNAAPSPIAAQATLIGQAGNGVVVSVISAAQSGGPYALSWRGEAVLEVAHYRSNLS